MAYLILRPSTIKGAGVGCFSLENIGSGKPVIPSQSEGLKKLGMSDILDDYLKFCIMLDESEYLAPRDFFNMNMLWYVNHAKLPNLEIRGNKLFAARDIEAGEELTLYYPDLLTHPKNKEWVKPEHI